jgi:hypothetical protein
VQSSSRYRARACFAREAASIPWTAAYEVDA